jgi:hypothetical protein
LIDHQPAYCHLLIHRLLGKGPSALAYFLSRPRGPVMRSKKVTDKTHGAERPIQGPTPHGPRNSESTKLGIKDAPFLGETMIGGHDTTRHDTRGTIIFVGLKSEFGQSIVEPGKTDPDLRARGRTVSFENKSDTLAWALERTRHRPRGCTEVENGDKTENAIPYLNTLISQDAQFSLELP